MSPRQTIHDISLLCRSLLKPIYPASLPDTVNPSLLSSDTSQLLISYLDSKRSFSLAPFFVPMTLVVCSFSEIIVDYPNLTPIFFSAMFQRNRASYYQQPKSRLSCHPSTFPRIYATLFRSKILLVNPVLLNSSVLLGLYHFVLWFRTFIALLILSLLYLNTGCSPLVVSES